MHNILPYEGEVFYHPSFLNENAASELFNDLLTQTAWQHDVVVIFGKRITTKRKTAWYGSKPYVYTYSGTPKVALPFLESLNHLRNAILRQTGIDFNSCLLNYYADGSESMGWHTDNERSLRSDIPIASVSLGASRKFSFKNKDSKERVDLELKNGSLLMMNPPTQDFWLHSLPKTTRVNEPRINLTFRMMREESAQ